MLILKQVSSVGEKKYDQRNVIYECLKKKNYCKIQYKTETSFMNVFFLNTTTVTFNATKRKTFYEIKNYIYIYIYIYFINLCDVHFV